MSSVLLGGLVCAGFGVGMGLTSAPATESIMGSLPPGKAGVGSAVNDTTRQTGGALGVAVLGSIFASRYHGAVDAAGGSLAGVGGRASGAGPRAAGRPLRAAEARAVTSLGRHSFVLSMRLAYGLAAGVV